MERFLREAQAAPGSSISHIVTIYDVGEKSDRYYFVIEYLEVTPYANTTSFRPRAAPVS